MPVSSGVHGALYFSATGAYSGRNRMIETIVLDNSASGSASNVSIFGEVFVTVPAHDVLQIPVNGCMVIDDGAIVTLSGSTTATLFVR